MDYNLLTNIQVCHQFKELAPMALVRYSHIPTAAISILIGLFVFLKNRQSLLSKILLIIALSFSLWSFLDLLNWEFGYNSILTMFSWALLGLVQAILFVFSLYFVYVFPKNDDVSIFKKITALFFVLPVIFLTPTRFNLPFFDITNCEATEGRFFTNYYYYLSLAVFLWILVVIFLKYRKAEHDFKKQILFMGLGIELFLLSFFATNFLASMLDNYNILIYGMFGMVVFMGFLAYLIVKFKAFNIKMLAAQALVTALVALIAAEFFFTPFENTTNIILISITVLISTVFGIWLINSVKNEVKRKEELQDMSDKLALANDQLVKLDNAKSEFISIASHQLRTPLTAIKGFVSLLLEGTYGRVEPKIRDALNKVYLSNERMVELVENLLNISRIESGRMEYQYQKWKVEDILHELYDTFFIMSKNKGLELKINLPAEPLPEVEIDGPKTKEVISNLIDNAIKYSDHGTVTVTAEIPHPADATLSQRERGLRGEGEFVRVSVSDTGIGIPKEELPYLFNKFSRGRDTNRLHATGTGLGLYVGKQMIEAQHGKMIIQSEGAGKGSTFIVELPISQEKFRREERVEEFIREI